MAKAKRLPSGNWRIQVQKQGVRRSFTAKNRRDAELMAAEWMAGREAPSVTSVSLAKGIQTYIDSCDGVLSPSTIKGYDAWLRQIKKHDIAKRNMSAITTADLQRFVKRLTRDYSAKSIHNIYGLISASLGFYGVPMPKGINLPPIRPKAYNVPNEEDMRNVLGVVNGTPMEIPVLLGMCGMRRSEISALTTEDLVPELHGVQISKALVEDRDKELITKGTKTRSSTRILILPPFIYAKLEALDPGPVTHLTPHAITSRWDRLRKKVGLETRFHDLRHFSVSLAHALGISDQYVMHRHGFSTDSTMKRIYRNEIDTYEQQANKIINDYYEEAFN